jgi:hypothetical protein
MNDVIGTRGESRFLLLITEPHDGEQPIFRAQPLGEKWPTIDFVVELLGAGGITPFFFVQVKTTRRGFTERGRRLKVTVPGHTVARLASFPAPTYIVGIDDVDGPGYIVSANGERLTNVASVPSEFPIDRENRERLWREVMDYWSARLPASFTSVFTDPAWEAG